MTATRTRTTTLRISRVIKAPRERAYRALLDTDAYAKRPPSVAYTGRAHPMGPREGGTYRTTSDSLHKRDVDSFGGRYVEIKPFGRIGHTGAFETDVPETEREVRVAIALAEVPSDTEVTAIQENNPAVTPVGNARAGWTMSLENLPASWRCDGAATSPLQEPPLPFPIFQPKPTRT